MTTTIAGFPYAEMQFNKEGDIHDQAEVNALSDLLDQGVTDLLVLSHGWNNDMSDARRLYKKLLRKLRKRIETDGGIDSGAELAILGVLWPSKKFANSELIASGAASMGATVDSEALNEQIANLKGGFDAEDGDRILDQLAALAPTIEDSKNAQDQFYTLALQLLDESKLDIEISEEVPVGWTGIEGREALDELSKPRMGGVTAGGDGPDAAAFGFLSGITGAAQSLLNLLTFYQMKHRAGAVGENGLHDVLLGALGSHPSLRIHLVGHSFGARLVTATLRGADRAARIEVRSLTLLQGAFSHNGLARNYDGSNDGHFRVVIDDDRVGGPVVITHTVNDKAVGIAYPLASRLKPRNASAIVGDKHDPYGGMGRNGAQNTPEARQMQMRPKGHSYQFTDGAVHNLNADSQIDDHGDVANQAVASVVLSALKA